MREQEVKEGFWGLSLAHDAEGVASYLGKLTDVGACVGQHGLDDGFVNDELIFEN